MSGVLAAATTAIYRLDVVIHNTSEGGGEGAYSAAAGDCTVQYASTGIFTGSTNGGSTATSPYNWLKTGLASTAEILFHQSGGTAVTGAALDTWLNLSTNRGVNLSWPGGAGSNGATLQVSVRDSFGNTLVNAVTITLATHP